MVQRMTTNWRLGPRPDLEALGVVDPHLPQWVSHGVHDIDDAAPLPLLAGPVLSPASSEQETLGQAEILVGQKRFHRGVEGLRPYEPVP